MVFVVGATPRPIAQGEDRVAALVGLARLKRDAGDFEAARRHYEQARALGTLEPAVVTEYFWLIGEDDAATALGVGREILQRAPASADVRDRTITIAIALEREHEVIELAEAGRRAHPQAALWPRRLGESYLRQARPADAVNAFRDAVALADRDVTDQIGLAVALEAAERPIDAVAVWAEVPAAARAGRPDWARHPTRRRPRLKRGSRHIRTIVRLGGCSSTCERDPAGPIWRYGRSALSQPVRPPSHGRAATSTSRSRLATARAPSRASKPSSLASGKFRRTTGGWPSCC
jgi:hypothetical protein